MIKNKTKIKSRFDIIKNWLDNFYMKTLNQSHTHLCEVLKLCLISSLGNARLESDFSIDSELIENSLKESSLL